MENRIVLNKEIIINNFDSHQEAIEAVFEKWQTKGYFIVNFLYWASYPLVDKNEIFAKALRLSDIIFPDGIGLYLYVRFILRYKLNNLNGTDLNPLFIKEAGLKNKEIAFYGADKENIKKAAENILRINDKLYYYQDGYSNLDWNKIKRDSILFVGLGSPIQEIWVSENKENIKNKSLLVITVGGYFDFISGKYKRAPYLVRKLKTEWLWRAPHCDRKRNFRNLYIFYFIIRDFVSIRRKNNIL